LLAYLVLDRSVFRLDEPHGAATSDLGDRRTAFRLIVASPVMKKASHRWPAFR
jgi:hypothetical protein